MDGINTKFVQSSAEVCIKIWNIYRENYVSAKLYIYKNEPSILWGPKNSTKGRLGKKSCHITGKKTAQGVNSNTYENYQLNKARIKK